MSSNGQKLPLAATSYVGTSRASALEQSAEALPCHRPPFPRADFSVEDLAAAARRVRRQIVTMVTEAQSGHVGGSLSATDIVTSLYYRVMRHDPTRPDWCDRDRFILSKGHCSPALYAILAECGYIPVSLLKQFRQIDGPLQGHPERGTIPGVEATTGSLGQGISIAGGMALAARLDKRDYRVYAVVGNGECNEGEVWEAAMFAAYYKIDNLLVVVDHNRQQNDGWSAEILDIEPLPEKWRAFGWHTIEVDGHDFEQLLAAYAEAATVEGQPTAIVAHTNKGRGVSFIENNPSFHGKAPTPDQLVQALKELADVE